METSSILLKVVPLAVRFCKPYFTRADERLADARRREFERNVVAALQWNIKELLERVEDLEGKLQTQASDEQYVMVCRNLGFEADREAIDERRRMLEHAAAGLIDPRISIEDKARVERKLRELDPIDVRTLYGISRVVGPRAERLRHEVWASSGMPGEVLLSAGCLREDLHAGAFGGAPPDLHVTAVGRLVLRAVRGFTLSRGAPFEVAGRAADPTHRSDELARASVNLVPELAEFLGYARTTSRIGKQFLQVGEGSKPAPHSPAYPCIRFNVFDLDKRTLCDAASANLDGLELSLSTRDEPWDMPMFVAFLAGPVDLLRYAAEFVDADWVFV